MESRPEAQCHRHQTLHAIRVTRMSRSHSLPVPPTFGVDKEKLVQWGFRPDGPDSENGRKRSRYLRNMFSGGKAPAADELYHGHPADREPFGTRTAEMLESLAVCMSVATPPNFFGQPIPDDNVL